MAHSKNSQDNTFARNRKAYHEYTIVETFEAGISLVGTEVKSIRLGKINITDGWVSLDGNRAILKQVHVSHYRYGNIFNHSEVRERQLLLKKRELKKLSAAVHEKGYTLVPISVYAKRQFIKIKIAVGKGKKLFDKRQSSKEKDAKREIERVIKNIKN